MLSKIPDTTMLNYSTYMHTFMTSSSFHFFSEMPTPLLTHPSHVYATTKQLSDLDYHWSQSSIWSNRCIRYIPL